MKPKSSTLLVAKRAARLLLLSTLIPQPSTLFAQVPSVISYQGRVQAGGTNFSGPGQFKFALVSPGTNVSRQATAAAVVTSGFITDISVMDGGGGYQSAPAVVITDSTGSGAAAVAQVFGGVVTNIAVQNAGSGYSASPTVSIAPPPLTIVHGTFWSNDGTSSAGSEPASAIAVPVQQGLFTVFLGDTNLPNMQSVPTDVFTQSGVHLRLWFGDGTTGFVQLVPDQRVGSVGYALMAAVVSEGGVSGAALSTGSVTSTKIENGTILIEDLSATLLNGAFWNLGGNSGTTPGTYFLGTADNQPVEIKVNGQRALRIEPATNSTWGYSPNILGGFSGNIISNGFVGAVIVGGGVANFPNRAGNHFATVVGGHGNTASGQYSTAMGRLTTASDNFSTAMGEGTTASGNSSTAMGGSTTASGAASTAMGVNTTASGLHSTAMGNSTTASGLHSTAMGNSTTASGSSSTAMGLLTTAGGNYSTAMGRRAKANHEGSFVSADSNNADVASTNANSVTIRAAGGYRLFSNSGATTGAYLAPGGGSWTSMSDRNAKENFGPVNARAVLDKVAALPMSTWNYKSQTNGVRHIGPMAQDFKAAFGVGETDSGITTVDADGVALAAIQGLNQKLQEELNRRDAENAELKQRLVALEKIILSQKSN